MKAKMIKAIEMAQGRKYPYIGYYHDDQDEYCVLFTRPNTGVCITDDYWPIGEYSSNWVEDNFMPFNGEITLSND